MLTYIYDIMFSCDMLMFVAMMSSYIPLYILLFKTTENNISVETMLVNKIRERQKHFHGKHMARPLSRMREK